MVRPSPAPVEVGGCGPRCQEQHLLLARGSPFIVVLRFCAAKFFGADVCAKDSSWSFEKRLVRLLPARTDECNR